ncbi:UDP-N-acetylmuramoyl-L-alanyl-D-glutamate--2,6-diaminopimelate ligase [Paenibacillus montanisoli]|uniref:UDP-N-acetylmuramyl-tripeptide synthetase n=1 Tax=Paenibacillus montanisoli TaxID=2081970 RepID=A0A328U4T9_9BACL|nr:UDP-N-acetylmuramoyl-L-alanyl-D-glutamate--2,6-diaminopimelate ligase [Paenibacillus montanisoli]
MQLHCLVDALLVKTIIGDADITIYDIQTDSRSVKPGDLFVCVHGFKVDGHDFIEEAARNGAAAVVIQRELPLPKTIAAAVIVPDTYKALAVLANIWYGNDDNSTKLIGITGTNGKTTTMHMIHHVLRFARRSAGMIGTLGFRMGAEHEYTRNTTPDVLTIQNYLARIRKQNGEYALIEASSHGLELGRLRGCDFRTVVFTNLTHDHLDFHHTMERYLASKKLLFAQLGNGHESYRKTAVLNGDDPASAEIASHTSAQVLRYGLKEHAEITAHHIDMRSDKTTFTVRTPWGDGEFALPLTGIHNVYNALAAISVCLVEGLPMQAIREGLSEFDGVRGRSQEVPTGKPYRVVVDYAHNPDGLNAIIHATKQGVKGKLLVVMGSRGDRDREKRPIMARLASDHAEIVILTSDNPGTEHPDSILSDMINGLNVEQRDRCLVIPDRQHAVLQAVSMANANDCILITGRGHENELEIGGRRAVMSDSDIVIEALEKHGTITQMFNISEKK